MTIAYLYTMKSFSDNLAGVGDQYKRFFVIFADIISQADRLHPVQGCENDILVLAGISALCVTNTGAAPQSVDDKIADWFRAVAHYVKIFGQVKALNESIDHERADRKPQKRVKSCLYIKYKESGSCDQRV